MAVDMVNTKITELDWDQVMQTSRGQVVPVCKATEAEWIAYLESDGQELKSSHMEWIDGEIFIVELPSREREHFGLALKDAIRSDRIVKHYLKAHGHSYNKHLRRYEPDQSFGPSRRAGGALPAGMEWVDWHTLKVEVGFTRHWGDEPGQLDWKANEWATFPGVAYILCVAVDEGLANATYKLHRIEHGGARLAVHAARPVAAQISNIAFDSRLLLGLQPGDALPAQFPDPLVVDLHEVLEDARDEFPALV